jgi:hypothetical protein
MLLPIAITAGVTLAGSFILIALIGHFAGIPECHRCNNKLKKVIALPIDEAGAELIPPGATYYCPSCSPTCYYRETGGFSSPKEALEVLADL